MTTLRRGDRGPAVRELQLLLSFTGHDPGPIDGIFGPRTRAAFGNSLDARYGQAAARAFDPGSADAEDLAHLRALPRRAVEVPRVIAPVSAVDMRIAIVAGYVSSFPDHEQCSTSPLFCPNMTNAVRVALAQLCVEHGCAEWGVSVEHQLRNDGLLPPAHLRPSSSADEPVTAYIYVWTNNVGNRQVPREDREERPFAFSGYLDEPLVPWFALTAHEGEGANVRRLTSACYAYPNIAEGAAGYWRFLRDHCGPALAAFERGDPAAAAHELKVGTWSYSGDEAAYTRAMVDRFRAIE